MRISVFFVVMACGLTEAFVLLRPMAFQTVIPSHIHGSRILNNRRLRSCRVESGAMKIKAILNEPQPPDEKVLKAVDKLGKRVTAADLATATGLSINDAQRQLSTLAQLTSGNLEVSKDGAVVYVFDGGYRGTLSARSGRRRVQEAWNTIAPALFYVVRLSFGVALIASIALVFTAILALQSSSSRDDRDERRGYSNDRGFNMYFGPSFWWGPSPFDFLFYNPYQPYGVNRYRSPSEMSFLEAVFSFLFGDGDPNSDLEERRYKAIAQLIRENKGVVTAEQLAPYMDPAKAYANKKDETMPDEGFLIPAVTQFQGRPEVTEDGDIVYVFDDLQDSATGGMPALKGKSAKEIKAIAESEGISTAGMFDRDDLAAGVQAALAARQKYSLNKRESVLRPYLEEGTYQFSLATSGQQLMVAALGAINLVGALYLGSLLSSPYVYGRELVGLLGFVQDIYPLLVSYALAFSAVPVLRWFKVKSDNDAIEKRNRLRASWAYALQKGGAAVQRKLAGAKMFGRNIKVIGQDDIDYSTAESAETQELKMWDRKFKSPDGK